MADVVRCQHRDFLSGGPRTRGCASSSPHNSSHFDELSYRVGSTISRLSTSEFHRLSHSSCSAQFHCNLIPICRPKLKSNWILIHCAISAALSWYGMAGEADETVLGIQTFETKRKSSAKTLRPSIALAISQNSLRISVSRCRLRVLFPSHRKVFSLLLKIGSSVCYTNENKHHGKHLFF